LVRHAIGITHVETTLATRPAEGEVGRTNACFGELFGHGDQPSSLAQIRIQLPMADSHLISEAAPKC
jgi:hypothetical protein